MQKEQNMGLYKKYEHNRIMDKTMPEFDMIKTLETYRRSVQAFNSYGLTKKNANKSSNPEAELNILKEKN